MRVQFFRETQSAWVKSAYKALKDIVGGDFSPGYFNSREVLIAEANGLRVLDGVLGHVLASSPGADLESRACGLLEKVSEALVPSEVENRCHNLHGACALMLDALGVPVIQVRGSVHATDDYGRAFWMNRFVDRMSLDHQPGHSWLLTPWWRVADLALVHQRNVAEDYEEMQDNLRPFVTVNSSEETEPDISWWRYEDGSCLPAEGYASATAFHELIGWSQITLGSATVRYLPSGLTLPKETEMGDVNIKIGGLSARQWFDANA